jgi:hypothetical protein
VVIGVGYAGLLGTVRLTGKHAANTSREHLRVRLFLWTSSGTILVSNVYTTETGVWSL